MSDGPSQRTEPVIVADRVTYTYPEPNPVRAVANISLTVAAGEFIAIIGRNGSGKTTFMKMLIGLLRPTSGKLTLLGRDAGRLSVIELSKRVGYVYQNPDRQIVMDFVKDEIALGPRNQRLELEEVRSRVASASTSLGLSADLESNSFTLSRGLRQRLAIASILAMRPPVMLIDEPTTGQDPAGVHRIMAILRDINENGTTVILITHDVELVAAYATRVIAFADGQLLADGTPYEVFAQPDTLRHTAVAIPPIASLTLKLFGRCCLTVEEATREYQIKRPLLATQLGGQAG
ncbi:ATP-binding cassette domain-containing protein [bacterium]|nr:MAG: ATP-binding cassette domain-containing protein [bacterium]